MQALNCRRESLSIRIDEGIFKVGQPISPHVQLVIRRLLPHLWCGSHERDLFTLRRNARRGCLGHRGCWLGLGAAGIRHAGMVGGEAAGGGTAEFPSAMANAGMGWAQTQPSSTWAARGASGEGALGGGAAMLVGMEGMRTPLAGMPHVCMHAPSRMSPPPALSRSRSPSRIRAPQRCA